jgi:hypothetical protein
MNTRKRIVILITAFCTFLVASGCACGIAPILDKLLTSSSGVPVGHFSCTIPVALSGTTDIVILSFTITPDHKIDSWSLFDFGTRTVSFGQAGKNSLNGTAVQFDLTAHSGMSQITYKINGNFSPGPKLSGDYTFNYGSSYGEVSNKFSCDLKMPATATPAP